MYKIYDLKCNDMVRPEGIDTPIPRFSWKLRSDVQNVRQKWYRVIVRSEDRETVWDSGEVPGEEVYGIEYRGAALRSEERYSVEVSSAPTAEGEAAVAETYFRMGKVSPDWKASWITAPMQRKPIQDCTEMWKIFAGIVTSREHPEEILDPTICFRRNVSIDRPVRRAIAYATAHGIYSLMIDGTTVSELLAPGFTTYAKYLEVQQYDVTAFFTAGVHTISATLADGWYTGRIGLPGVGNQYGDRTALYLQIELVYDDGTCETIVSDDSFRWHEGAEEYADLIVGERFRQGFLPNNWNRSDFDDSDWTPAELIQESTDVFRGRCAEPVRVLRTTAPKEVLTTPAGELVVDVGENIVGVLAVRFLGHADTVLRMTHSEVLDRDGNFLMNILGQNKNQMDVYVCNKDGEVSFCPQFTTHGFRYAKIEGIEKEQLLDVQVRIIGTDLEATGTFQCSDERLNRLQENIFRSQQGNMVSIPTDCPQRERAGWTGDMQVYAPTACFNMDVKSFLEKWLSNMRVEQLDDGQIPNIVPSMPIDRLVLNSDTPHICSAAWGDACVIVPYVLYRKYGDIRVLRDNYDMMQRWMHFVQQEAASSFPQPKESYTQEQLERQKYLWNTEFHYGDWLYPSAFTKEHLTDPMQTAFRTKEYVAPAMFAYTTELMVQICEALGENSEAQRFRELNEKIRWAYAGEYIDAEGHLPIQLQGLYVLALAMGLYPEDKKAAGLARLTELIDENGGALDTGFTSIPFLLDTLWDNGERELAWKLLFREESPSWLYEVKMGATTVWESWNAILPDGTRTNSSYNHFAFGCVGDFLYRKILGLTGAEPGYRSIRIAPDLSCGLRSAEGSLESPYGRIEIRWCLGSKEMRLEVQLPPGIIGEVILPGTRKKIGSGKYAFSTLVTEQ